MGNTLTNLIPTIMVGLNEVSREQVGLTKAVRLDASLARAAKDQSIRTPIVPAMSAGDVAAAATGPDPSAQNIGNVEIKITKARSVPFFWEGEEQVGMGGLINPVLKDQFAEAMRTLVNEMETDLAALYIGASRATGAAGVTPFGSNLAEAADALGLMEENGAPVTDLHMVLDSAALAKLRKLTQLTNVGDAGTDETLRRGILGDIFGLKVGYSPRIKKHTKGAGTGYVTNGGEPAAETAVAVDTGTGTILAGDCLTFENESVVRQYVVAAALGTGVVTIAKPGLREAIGDGEDVTVLDSYRANMVFSRNAICLIARAPAMPQGGDAADDVMEIIDPVSGLPIQIALYRQRRRVVYEVGLAWGCAVVKPEHLILLKG